MTNAFRVRQHAYLCLVCGVLAALVALAEETQMTAESLEGEGEEPAIDLALKCNFDKDGKVLPVFKETKGWKNARYYSSGEVRVEGDTATLEKGHDMTGIKWTGPLVRMNFEVTLEAKRVEGGDFFCGLTVPYGEDHCSLILGGWGGTCCGISCLDFNDAYNNETAVFRQFETGRWYRVRLRITGDKIEAWIDDERIVDVATTGRKIDIRWEMKKCLPFGVATWQTTGAIRNIRMRAFEEKQASVNPEKDE